MSNELVDLSRTLGSDIKVVQTKSRITFERANLKDRYRDLAIVIPFGRSLFSVVEEDPFKGRRRSIIDSKTRQILYGYS